MSKKDAVKLLKRIEQDKKLMGKLKQMKSDTRIARAIRGKAKQWRLKVSARDYYEAVKDRYGDDLSRKQLNKLKA